MNIHFRTASIRLMSNCDLCEHFTIPL